MSATADPEHLPTYRITMICSGNICRSPMAEVVLADLVANSPYAGAVAVDSAGLGSWHVGDGADHRTIQVLADNGHDGSRHVVRQFSPDWFAERDLVLAADSSHVRDLRRLAARSGIPGAEAKVAYLRSFDPAAVSAGTLEVDDPWYGSIRDFRRTYAEVTGACRGIVQALPELLAAGRSARPGDGAAAAAAAGAADADG